MLYHLFSFLTEEVTFFNVYKYLTFRGFLAALTSMCIWVVIGLKFINMIMNFKIMQYIREECLGSHK